MKAIDRLKAMLKRLREDEDYRDWNNDEARAEFEDVGEALEAAGVELRLAEEGWDFVRDDEFSMHGKAKWTLWAGEEALDSWGGTLILQGDMLASGLTVLEDELDDPYSAHALEGLGLGPGTPDAFPRTYQALCDLFPEDA